MPRWIPGIGGWIIPRWIPLAIGTAGAIALVLILGSLLFAFARVWAGGTEGWTPDRGMDGGERAFLLVCYVPFFAWPVAILAALVGYARRRRPEVAVSDADDPAGPSGGPRLRAS